MNLRAEADASSSSQDQDGQGTKRGGLLSPYRVLDLTDQRGLAAGQILARLGADVIQIEPPQGSSARNVPPHDRDGQSLYWAAFAAGKRSLACDIRSEEGRALFEALLRTADVLIETESARPPEDERISYAYTSGINAALIHVSITPFGRGGPKDDYADSDLILWAAGGALWPSRDADDRGPVRISVPQAYLHAAADAAGGALVALQARHQSGRGQHVEISVQQSVMQATLSSVVAAAVAHEDFALMPQSRGASKKKALDLSGSGSRTRRSKWQVADGLAEMHLAMGPSSGRSSNSLFAWMKDEGALPDRFADWDWVTLPLRYEQGELDESDIEAARAHVAAFLEGKTKQDILEQAIRRRILLAPICSTVDLVTSPHHVARRFFTEIDDHGRKRLLPGAFAMGVPHAFTAPRPAPEPGEHNESIRAELSARNKAPAIVSRSGGGARPFSGLKVLDLAWVVAGPAIGRVLADYGATVVRVETSKRIETARLMGPFPGGHFDPERSALYDNYNANKLGLSVDLAHAEGRALVRRLAGWADVVIESFSPGQMARWELGYQDLQAVNPSLVMLSTSLMGQTGPYAAFAGYGNIGAAMAGFQAIVGWPDKLPVGPFGPYTDYVGPRYGLVALLAALDHRRRTGEGAWLDISQAEAGIQFLAPQIAEAAATGRSASAHGNRDPSMAPHGVYRCRDDQWISIAARTDADWRALVDYLGCEALRDPSLAHFPARKAREDYLDQVLGAWLSGQPAQKIEKDLQAVGVAAHLVAASADIVADPQLIARGHFIELPHPSGGVSVIEASRFRLSDTPARYHRCAPTFGRDNEIVLRDILGCTPGEIERLSTEGVTL